MRRLLVAVMLSLALGLALAGGGGIARAAGCTDLASPNQNLTGCDLNHARITGVGALFNSNLSGDKLNHVSISGTGALQGADLTNALADHVAIESSLVMTGATLKGADVDHLRTKGWLNLANADLTGADLRDSELRGFGVLLGADLTNAKLERLDVDGDSPLNAVNLTGANLRGAHLNGKNPLDGATFSNTVCPDGTNSNSDGGSCAGHFCGNDRHYDDDHACRHGDDHEMSPTPELLLLSGSSDGRAAALADLVKPRTGDEAPSATLDTLPPVPLVSPVAPPPTCPPTCVITLPGGSVTLILSPGDVFVRLSGNVAGSGAGGFIYSYSYNVTGQDQFNSEADLSGAITDESGN